MKRHIDRMPKSLRQMAIYGSGLVLTKVISLLMVPVFTNFLSPADYGRLDVLQTLANLLSIVIAFGMGQSLFRFAGEAREQTEKTRTAAEIFGLALFIGAVSLIVTQLFAAEITHLLPAGVTEVQVRLILGSLSLSGAILVPMSWLRMRDKAFSYFAASAGCAVVQAGLSAVLLFLGYGIEGVLFSGLVCMGLATVCVFVWQLKDTGVRVSRSGYGRYGHFGSVLVFAGIAAFIMDSFPRWILAGSAGPAEMAIFALAAKIAMIAGFLTHPFEMWWMPRRFSVLTEPNGLQAAARAGEKGLLMAMAASIAVGAAAPLVVKFLTPAAYHGAVAFVPALALLMATNAAVRIVNIGCMSAEKTVWPLIIDVTAAALACLGYFAAVPSFGGWGIVAVTSVAVIGRLTAYLVIGARIVPIPYAFSKLALPALITVGAGGILSACSSIGVSLLAGGVAMAALAATALLSSLIPNPGIRMIPWRPHVPS